MRPELSTEDATLAAARAYADSIAPGAAERDRAGVAPRAELTAFDATGLLAITVPKDDGGPGLGPSVLAEVVRTLAAADPSVAQTPQAHYLFVDGAALLGSPELRERLVAALVRREAEGVTVDEDWNVIGQRATASATTTLQDVVVDDEMVLPWGMAFAGPQQLGARAQLYHAAIEVGIAGAALAVAQAKALGSEVAVQVSSELFALSGASAADSKHALDRHWRNARTHSIHDPVDWKYHHVAAFEVDGVLPPNHAQL